LLFSNTIEIDGYSIAGEP